MAEPEPEPEMASQDRRPSLSSLAGLPPIDLMPDLQCSCSGLPPIDLAPLASAASPTTASQLALNLEQDKERQLRCGDLASRSPEYLGEHNVKSDAEEPTRVGNLLLTVEMTEETGLGQGVLRVFHKPLAGRRRAASGSAQGLESIIVPLVTVGRDAADTYLLRHIAGHRVRVLSATPRKTDPTQVVLNSGGTSQPLSPPQQSAADQASAVDVSVAIDKPLPLPEPLAFPTASQPTLRLPHIDTDTSRELWLSISSLGSSRWGCSGSTSDALDLVLSATPHRVAQPAGGPPPTNPELGSTGEPWWWKVELSLLVRT